MSNKQNQVVGWCKAKKVVIGKTFCNNRDQAARVVQYKAYK